MSGGWRRGDNCTVILGCADRGGKPGNSQSALVHHYDGVGPTNSTYERFPSGNTVEQLYMFMLASKGRYVRRWTSECCPSWIISCDPAADRVQT